MLLPSPKRAWLLAILFLLLVAPLQMYLHHEYDIQVAAYRRFIAAQDALDRAAYGDAQRIHNRFCDDHRGEYPTRADAATLLHYGKPIPAAPGMSPSNHEWTSPTGGRAMLIFSGNTWTATTPSPTLWTVAAAYPDPNIGLYGYITIGRRIVSVVLFFACPALWWGIIAAFNKDTPDQRVARANRLLVVAVVATALGLLGPRYFGAWVHFNEDDSPAWGWILIPAGAAWLAFTIRLRAKHQDPLACLHCRYSLFHNTSGTCPECGTRIPATQRAHIRVPSLAPASIEV